MERERWRNIRAVFDAIADAPADEREGRLAAEEPGVRAEVEALLASHDAITAERLAPGAVVGRYEIVDVLGDGGMGTVYRARQKEPIARDVALKVVRGGFVNADLLRRFDAERQTLASLNHPNIAAVLDAGKFDGRPYFVMEYVDGVPVTVHGRRLGRRERLALMEKVCDAIHHAHANGIVHRDLKPTNVLVTVQEGRAVPKVIDFGIAKSVRPDAASHTMTGQLLGTPAYMSPEQARGRPVDSRTDLWAIGCLLYELETGEPAFPTDTVGDTIAAVLNTEPDLGKLPADTPEPLRRLLRRCLKKDPEERQSSAADARLELADARKSAQKRTSSRRWAWIAAPLVVLLAVAALRPRDPVPEKPPSRRLQVVAAGVSRHEHAAPVLAPDGSAFAYVADDRLWVRRLDSLEAYAITGTEGAQYPFWSPDSGTLGFFAGGAIRRVPATGGEITRVFELRGDVGGGAGACWTKDGVIAYSRGNTPLFAVPAPGGERTTLYDPPKAHVHKPVEIPGGLLFVVHGVHAPNIIAVLARGDCDRVLHTGLQRIGGIAWSPTGHILMARGPVDAGVWAVPYDAASNTCGEAVRIAPDGGWPSVSEDGLLLYVPGAYAVRMQLGWVDREGAWGGDVGQPDPQYRFPSLSPDGKRVAVTQRRYNSYEVWVHDIGAGTRSRITFEEEIASWCPAWTPDGAWLVGHENTTDTSKEVDLRLWMRRADGRGKRRSLGRGWVPDVSADGKYVAFGTMDNEIAWTRIDDPRQREVLVKGALEVRDPEFSPDDAFVAYTSNESGLWEVAMTRFPEGGAKWQLTRGGGTLARWSEDGSRVYFVHGNAMHEVQVFRDPVRVSPPRLVFEGDPLDLLLGEGYDVKGDRFLVVREVRAPRNEETVVLVDEWATAVGTR